MNRADMQCSCRPGLEVGLYGLNVKGMDSQVPYR